MNKLADWNVPGFALIQDIDTFARLRDAHDLVFMTSGGFDPIHPGHISTIVNSADILAQRKQETGRAGIMVVVVNDDAFLERKKGKAFQDIKTRCLNIAGIRGVDVVIPYLGAPDDTVIGAIEAIRPTAFTKGGDRFDASNIPEWDVCQRLGVEIITGVGLTKNWSSSNFLRDWGNFCIDLEERMMNFLNEKR